MLESLSVHQTFLCILHLANEYQMRLIPKSNQQTAVGDNCDFAMFKEDPGQSEAALIASQSQSQTQY